MSKLETTLCLLRKESKILLAKKKRGFGEGKYNGVGGKLEENETPERAMLRETEEEIGVIPLHYEKVGLVEFDEYIKGKKERLIFHLYVCDCWEGEPVETEEMQPKWFSLDAIPYDAMFFDDQYWLPLILEGKKIKAYFRFDEEWNLLVQEINVLHEEDLGKLNR